MLSKEVIDSIIEQANALAETESIELMRSISCRFFIEGQNPICLSSCRGCKNEEQVIACKDLYLKYIYERPQLYWTEDFEKPSKREKIRMDSDSIGLHCDTCIIRTTCFVYKPNALCGIEFDEHHGTTETLLSKLISLQWKRVQLGSLMEQHQGGMPNLTTSAEMERLAKLIAAQASLGQKKTTITISAETNDSGGQTGGILSQLLGKKSLETSKVETIEIDEDGEYSEMVVKEEVKKPKPKKNIKKDENI